MKVSTKLMIVILVCIASCITLVLNDCPWWGGLFAFFGFLMAKNWEAALNHELKNEARKP